MKTLQITLTLQKEFAKKAGIAANIPEATIKVMQDTTEEVVKATSIQNQVTLATIDEHNKTSRPLTTMQNHLLS